MAIETAPRAAPAVGDTKTDVLGTMQIRYTWTVLGVRQSERMESVDYRWTQEYPAGADINGKPIEASSATGLGNAETPITPLSLEVLHDRWDGLMHSPNGDSSELQEQLDDVLRKLGAGMVRRDGQAEYWEGGEPILIDNVTAIDELDEIIRDWLCRPEIARIAR